MSTKESTHIAIPYGDDGMCYIQRKKVTTASESPLSPIEQIVVAQYEEIKLLGDTIDKAKQGSKELKDFLRWLVEENIARWYFIDKESGGEGEDTIIERYVKERDE